VTAPGACCSDGDCLCHGPDPKGLTSMKGPYATKSYALAGAGCVHYPTDAEPPFAAVTISDGYGGSGGCSPLAQTSQWGALYASWGIVAMIVDTTGLDQPPVRGEKLLRGVDAFKKENDKSDSPLNGKLSGRYGTSGFSMGGGGTSFASRDGDGLKTSVAIMPFGPATSGVDVPTLVICGSTDGIASCAQHGNALYRGIGGSVPKMRVTVSSGHSGQPTAGMGKSGEYAIAFQKVFLEGDERWRPFLVDAESNETTIK
jgi:dienelactone hydrolase